MKLTPHFSLEEARCRCGRDHSADMFPTIETLTKTAQLAETVRAILGEPMFVNSFWRCPLHNSEVGGAVHSEHLTGHAIDFTCKHLSPRQVQNLLKSEEHRGKIGGLGCYPGFTHIDRGTLRNW